MTPGASVLRRQVGFPTFVAGRGMVDSEVLAVDRAANEYDERLYFDRNQNTGQWCVFLKTPANEPDLPIFGWDIVPYPDDALKRIYHADALRHGEEILDQIDRANDERERPYKEAVEEAEGQLAEAFEWGARKMGTHPTSRIFVPDKE